MIASSEAPSDGRGAVLSGGRGVDMERTLIDEGNVLEVWAGDGGVSRSQLQ